MSEGNDTNDGNKYSECSTGTSKPQHDERKNGDDGSLNVVVDRDATVHKRLGVEEVKIKVRQCDEYTAQEGEWGGEDGQGRDDKQNDKIVERIILAILTHAVEKLIELGFAHLRGVHELGPGTGAGPHIAQAIFERVERRHEAGDSRKRADSTWGGGGRGGGVFGGRRWDLGCGFELGKSSHLV